MRHSTHRSFVLSVCATVLLGSSVAQTSVFIGSSVAGNTDPWYLVDVDASLLLDQGSSERTNNVSGAFFHPESDELVVSSGLGHEVSAAPVLGLSPDFQSPLFQTPLAGGSVFDCVYDARFKRIFSLTRDGAAGIAYILDGDPLSTTYGTVMHAVSLPAGAERFRLSEDSTLLSVPGALFDGSLAIMDVDPASPGFLSITQSPVLPLPGLSFALGTTFSPDNRFVSVLLFSFSTVTAVAKYDRQTQTWIDGFPSIPSLPNFPIPVSIPESILPIRGTESALVTGSSGSLGLLEMPGSDPANWLYSPLQSYPGSLNGSALSPDGTRLAATLSDPPRLVIADAVDGIILSETALPADAANLYTVAWSDEGFNPVAFCGPAPANSTGVSAQLTAAGSAFVSDNDVLLTVSDLPPLSFGFLITSLTQGFVANPGGSQGNLCISGAIGRYVGPGQIQQASAGGEWGLQIDLNQQPQPNGSVAAAAGDSWNYQAWYRDNVGGQSTSNFTQGLTIAYR